jgi:ribosomal protein S18 acetylase RimI-like enzyme
MSAAAVIRRAVSDDVPALLGLVRELASFEREPEAVRVNEASMRQDGFGPRPVWFGWLAEDAGEAVGMALCFDRYSTWTGRILYLEDLYVRPASRGRGLGEALVRTCARHALAEGYRGMRLQVLDWNAPAIAFYQRLGWRVSANWHNADLDAASLERLAGSG